MTPEPEAMALRSTPNQILLVNGKGQAVVDAEDYEAAMQHRWYRHSKGYAVSYPGGETVLLHRFVGARMGLSGRIDHENRDRLDCQRSNLRSSTASTNGANSGVRKNNKLGLKGVDMKAGKYRAQIKVNYKSIHLGYFDTREEASAAHAEASRKYFGEFGSAA